jgi:hypothetical protein
MWKGIPKAILSLAFVKYAEKCIIIPNYGTYPSYVDVMLKGTA